MIVLCTTRDEAHPFPDPHPELPRLLDFNADLPWIERADFTAKVRIFGCAVLGAPRSLLNYIRPNLPAIPGPEEVQSGRFDQTYGSLLRDNGYDHGPFREVNLAPPVFDSKELIYSPESRQYFHFQAIPRTAYQRFFLREIGLAAEKNKTQLVEINIPRYAERTNAMVEEPMFWPDEFGPRLIMIGVAPKRLFGPMPESAIKLFYEDEHLNINGARLYTRAIAPALINVFPRPNAAH